MTMMKRLTWFAAILLLVCGQSLFADDWAHWRGPEQNGVSREKNLVEDWSLETGENVLWTSEIGGRATPIVLNGRVYLNCRTADDVTDPKEMIDAQEQVVCWDAESGDVLWQKKFNVFQTDIPAPRVGWASMVGDTESGNVFVHSVSGILRCYTPDGDVVWEHSLFEEYGKISGYGGRTVTPIIDEDRLIVSFMAMNWGETKAPPPKLTYYAFDKNDGRLLWVSAPGGAPDDTIYSVPIVTVIEGTRMLISGDSDGGVYAIHARTGEKLWGFKMSRRGLNCSPVVEGKYVYITHGEDNIDNVQFGRVQCIDATGRGDITETHSVWRKDGIKAGYSSNLVYDGILYVVSDNGLLYAFDSQSGDQLWTHDLGTVGKGSPVWADGKLYVMEVNGNIHILKPSREKCESLSHNELRATSVKGWDEIYASPAISNGKVYFVTRDRTICVGNKDVEPSSDPIPPMEEETAPGETVALAHLVPYEVALDPGETASYELRGYDENGRLIKTEEASEMAAMDNLTGVTIEGSKLTVPEDIEASAAGNVSAALDGVEAKARVRAFSQLPWEWDFEDFSGKDVPGTWVNAFLKLQPTKVDDTTAMRSAPGPGRPSFSAWLGDADMSGYTIQCDVMSREERRQMSNIGITAQRYNLVLKGNQSKLEVISWAPHRRMARDMRFRWDPDVWYTMKLQVDVDDQGAHVRGKVWERDKEEPEEWTIEALDPHPNTQGSPGLYNYRLSESFYDNVKVTKEN